MADNVRRSRRLIVAAVGTAVIAGGGAIAVAATSDGDGQRAVATAERTTVTQTVESSGTVSTANKAAPSFPVSGTIESVDVAVGDTVSKGQVLARLDTTALQSAVDSDQQKLANAEQQLESDKAGQTSLASAGFSTVAPSAYDTGSASTEIVEAADIRPANSPDPVGQIDAAQNAVIDAQKKMDAGRSAVDAAQKVLDADVTENARLRDAEKGACSGETSAAPTTTPSTTPTVTPSATPTAPSSPVPSACSVATAAYGAFADTLTTDSGALSARISAQDGYEEDLQGALNTLDKLVDQLQTTAGRDGHTGDASGAPSGKSGGSTAGNAPKTTRGRTGSGTTAAEGAGRGGTNRPSGGSTAGTPSNRRGSSTGTGIAGSTTPSRTAQPASAGQLAADQADIDAAQAELTVARQNLAQATLSSPIAGTVAAVGMTAGSSANGQSITIIGGGQQDVEVEVPLGEIELLKKGQPVTIRADGVGKTLHGSVQSIGLLSGSSDSNPSYPVGVVLDSGSPSLFDGAGADVTITTGTAVNAVTVPNSAIRTIGARHTVTVVHGSGTTTVPVQIGIVGADRTQIISGVKIGETVRLADPSEPLPSDSTSGNVGGSRFPGGFNGRLGGS